MPPPDLPPIVCTECDDLGYIWFFPWVELMVDGGALNPFGGFETGHEYQLPCPYCNPYAYWRKRLR